MVIQFKHRGKQYFLQSKAPRRQPQITPFRSKAGEFRCLHKCKCVRDDILEYFGDAVITS